MVNLPLNSGIYPPGEDSCLLQKFVKIHAFGRVLEIGTGSGIQALTASGSPKVREVMAMDINPKAITELKAKTKKNKKIKTKVSNLFSQVSSRFDTIIFNPPYLPTDKENPDPALDGGKHGWEISERFFSQVSRYLNPEGIILFLFSTLTNKNKIDELVAKNLLEFQELGKEKLAFEELFVYLIKKSEILKELDSKKIKNIRFLAKGKRGLVFSGNFGSKKVAVKLTHPDSLAANRIENEATWLKILNKKKIGPKLFFSGENYLVMEFVEGKRILDWIEDHKKNEIQIIIQKIFQQCFILDQLGVNKKELHHPLKHIIINQKNKPMMIDFERCKRTPDVRNVTQLVEFLCRNKTLLEEKRFKIEIEKLRGLARKYKERISKDKLRMIAQCFSQ